MYVALPGSLEWPPFQGLNVCLWPIGDIVSEGMHQGMHESCELSNPGRTPHRRHAGSGIGRSHQLRQSSADAVAQSAASP